MRQPISQLTQSRFYSPAFNAAIFDGALRIYFAQYQEALALKVYFKLQERWREQQSKSVRSGGLPNIFVMLYPTDEIFSNSFPNETEGRKWIVERLGEDFVLGICGPVKDEDFEGLYILLEQMHKAGRTASPPSAPPPAMEA